VPCMDEKFHGTIIMVSAKSFTVITLIIESLLRMTYNAKKASLIPAFGLNL
jgi:hypothetical protein